VLSTGVEEESRYELVGITESDGIVFTLGDDEEEDGAYGERIPLRNDSARPRTDSLLLQQYPYGTAPSRMSSGSDGTLHDEPMEMESHTRPKYQQQRGAFDHPPHSGGEGIEGEERQGQQETTIWVPKEDKMTMRRFGEICLTWIRRSQVIVAYITVLAGFVVYTVRSPG